MIYVLGFLASGLVVVFAGAALVLMRACVAASVSWFGDTRSWRSTFGNARDCCWFSVMLWPNWVVRVATNETADVA